ncbi:MAG: rhamnulose-1-phosphate aldolase [Lachnospiraceae bacterium]|nr:rhamnulose-1-phosphate aldolase [Lachnospiraceae bacterium]
MKETAFFNDFLRMADDAWHMGWHESNGGNLSYRLRDKEADEIRESFMPGDWHKIGVGVPVLASSFFIMTASGSHFRNMLKDPETSLGIIEVDDTGERYRQVWGYANGGRPTSELAPHLLNHQVKMEATGGVARVIYHAHPSDIIALSFVLPLEDEAFTKELWGIMTECPIVFPSGIGVLKWLPPGSLDLAIATSKLMDRYDAVVWAHHGIFAAGADFDSVFGLVHTIEKSSGILLKVMSTGRDRLSGITSGQFKELAARFDLKLDERFL